MASPLALAGVFLAGLVLGRLAPPPAGVGLGLGLGLLGLGLLAVALPPRRLRRGERMLLASLLLATGLAGWLAGRPPPPGTLPPPGLARVLGRVEGTRHGVGDDRRALVRVLSGERLEDGAPVAPGTLLWLRDAAPPLGSRLRTLAKITPLPRFRNLTPHPPWPRSRVAQGGARLPPGARPMVFETPPVVRGLAGLRDRARHRLRQTLTPEAAALARALVLGEGAAVDDAAKDAVRQAGLAHVLAVSGLHVALVAGAAVAALGWWFRRLPSIARRQDVRRPAAAAGIVIAFAYALFAGGNPSALRAALTASLGWALVAAGRRPDPMAVAGGAILILGLAFPGDAADPRMLLSVLATVALVTSRGALLPEALRLPGSLSAGFDAALRTGLATAPVVLWCFGSLPAWGLVANLLLVPVAALALLPLALGHAVAAVALPSASTLTAPLFEAVVDAFLASAEVLGGPAPASGWPPPTVGQGVVVAGVVLALLAFRRTTPRVAAVAAGVVLVLLLEADLRHREQPRGVLRATFLDVGQGDATLVDLPDGSLLMVDAGGAVPGGGTPDPGEHVIAPLLAARRRARVDVVVASHPHPDHVGGLAALATNGMPIAELWASTQAEVESPSGAPATLFRRLAAAGARRRTPADLCDRPRRFGRAVVELLGPCPRYRPEWDENDNSLVLRISFGAHRLLLAGDIEAPAEGELAGRLALRADVLKVPHHGSATSSTPAWLSAVRPRLAVVSAGRGNRFGHPHPEVVDRYRRRGIALRRIDQEGSVMVLSDGRRLRIRTATQPSWR